MSILWFIREDGSVNNSKLLPDIYHYYSSVAARLELLPAISGWKAYDARVEPFERVSAFIDERYVYNASDTTTTFNVLRYEVKYCRSAFVRMFTIMIMVFMWIMSIFLLALSLDHVLIRPRSLEPDTVGYSVGMLFALPTLRMLLDAPLGSYVDYWSFAWNLVLVAVAVVIFFSGSYAGGPSVPARRSLPLRSAAARAAPLEAWDAAVARLDPCATGCSLKAAPAMHGLPSLGRALHSACHQLRCAWQWHLSLPPSLARNRHAGVLCSRAPAPLPLQTTSTTSATSRSTRRPRRSRWWRCQRFLRGSSTPCPASCPALPPPAAPPVATTRTPMTPMHASLLSEHECLGGPAKGLQPPGAAPCCVHGAARLAGGGGGDSGSSDSSSCAGG